MTDDSFLTASDHAPLQIAVIVASARRERVGGIVGDWVRNRCELLPGVSVDLIDLADVALPPSAELAPGGGGETVISARIDRADAYVVVTPEYNHSYPASLKHAIDWHYREWMFKAATVVPYGVMGGLLAAEHLRGVFAELSVVTTRRIVGLRQPWAHLGEDWAYLPQEGVQAAFDTALAELVWWSQTLRTARHERPLAL